jgi:prevent-host-death family protein
MAEADPKLPTTVNVHEAKTHLSKLLERVKNGEEIVIAKAGKPYARLVPAEPLTHSPRRQPGALKGIIPPIPDSFFFDPLPEEELEAWEGKYSSF